MKGHQEKVRDQRDLGTIVLRVGAARCNDLQWFIYSFIKGRTKIGTTRASWLSECWLFSPSTLEELSHPCAWIRYRTVWLIHSGSAPLRTDMHISENWTPADRHPSTSDQHHCGQISTWFWPSCSAKKKDSFHQNTILSIFERTI